MAINEKRLRCFAFIKLTVVFDGGIIGKILVFFAEKKMAISTKQLGDFNNQ